MNYCTISYAGSEKAPYNWITSTRLGVNRLIYITGGEGGYVKDGKKIPFQKDCLYLIPGNVHFIPTYTSYESDEARLDHVYANFEFIPPLIAKDVFCMESFDDEETKIAVEAFNIFCTQCHRQGGYINLSKASQEFLKNIVIFLMNKIAEKFNCEIVKDEAILNALLFMHENIGKKLPVSELAKAHYLSTNTFIRRFKKEVGETPYSYLKRLKIRTAQNMRMSGAPLEEVAEKCGYSDSSALLHAMHAKAETT